VNHPQIAAFARLAKEDTPPTRALAGQKTLISRTMHDLAYDPIHDEIVVTSPLTQAILVFRGGATGEEPPIRVIQGPHTQILGVGAMDKVAIDPDNNEILIATAKHNVLVFPREANGDAAPIRVLGGPDTQIKFADQAEGGGNVPPIRVDPVHNLLIVPSNPGSLLIFERTASGNTKPKAVIGGPKTGIRALRGQLQVYPPKGWIIVNTGPMLSIWSINDSGDVPPRWRIPLQQVTGAGGATGVALDPLHKEVFIANGVTNRVMTFYFPEIF
jgi:hypothetical protein